MFRSMKVLNSIDEVLEILETPCVDCVLHGSDGMVGKYSVKRDGVLAVFTCDLFHEYKAIANFVVSDDELKEFTRNFKSLANEEGMKTAHRKLQAYAQFSSPNLKLYFDGYCLLCGREAQIRVEDGEIYYTCIPCSTIKHFHF
jgi:hypothetical protein